MKRKWIVVVTVCALAAAGIELVWLTSQWRTAPEQVTAYMLSEDLKPGAVIEEAQLKVVLLEKGSLTPKELAAKEMLVGKTLLRPLSRGKVLLAGDFEPQQQEKGKETLVLKLNQEQSHLGDLAPGESIKVFCYRQGATEVVEDLIVKKLVSAGEAVGDAQKYVTLEGDSDKLARLFLAQQEGVACIVKKTTVQIP